MINFETKDIMLLYSLVNMKLRDEFLDLDDLVNYYGVDKKELLDKFSDAGYEYVEEENQFKKISGRRISGWEKWGWKNRNFFRFLLSIHDKVFRLLSLWIYGKRLHWRI